MGEAIRLQRAGDAELLRAVRGALGALNVGKATLNVTWLITNLQPTTVQLTPKAEEETASGWAMLMGIVGVRGTTFRWTGLDAFPQMSVTITRSKFFDELSFGVAKSGNQLLVLNEDLLKFISVVEEALGSWRAGADLTEVVGQDLARFYTARDQQVVRLEELNGRIIRENHEYRQRLEDEFRERRAKLEAELDARRTEEDQRLAQIADELEDRKKALDDRSATHARRDQYRGLMQKIQARSQKFALSKDTEGKRRLTHFLFALLLLALGGLALVLRPGAAFAGDLDPIWAHVRFGAVIASFIGAVIYYIRWTDAWFQRNATEEFRLKRHDLDLDRAGWLVELAMEAADAEDRGAMVGLMERLSRGLFTGEDEPMDRATHPADDIRTLLLEAAGSVEVELPGFGRVTLGQKDVQKLKKQIEQRKAEESERVTS